jgi:hypothetical protein
MKCKVIRFIPAGALLCIALASCKKNDQPTPSSSQTASPSLLLATTNTVVTAGSEQSNDMAEVMGSNIVASGDSTSCRTVTYNPSRSAYPHTATINFGSSCTGLDGFTRSGKKIITVYADWRTAPAGTLISETTFSNFYIDSVNVAGNMQTYIDSAASPGPLALKIVTNKTITDSKGNTSTYTATSYWLQTAGNSTTTRKDNVYQITGSASGTEVLDGATPVSWTSSIDPNDPVIKMGDCMFRSKGIEQIRLNVEGTSMFTESLDYGNGTCDDIATLTINGGTPQQVTLPLQFWPLSH